MKRTGIKRGKPLKPGKPLKRTAMKRRPKKREPGIARQLLRQMQEAFSKGIRSKRCVRCNRAAPGVVIRAHHVLRRSIIEGELRHREEPPEKVHSAAWDTRNRLPVCDECHELHHHPSSDDRKLHIDLVVKHAPKAIQFARELDLLDRMMADYDTRREDKHGRDTRPR